MKGRFSRIMGCAAVTLVIAVCLCAVFERARGCLPLADDTATAAGLLSFANGRSDSADKASETPKPKAVPTEGETVNTTRTLPSSHTGNSYPVTEINLSDGNESVGNLHIKNSTGYTPDYAAALSGELPFSLDDSRRVQVLIYHTHTCESYMTEDSGVYYEDFYPRSRDPLMGVCAVGEAVTRMLKARGIGVVHDTTLHDYPSYDGSYDRSYDTVSAYLEKYPDIKVTIDLHRDSMTADDGTKYKPTFTYEGHKAAQLMIMTGHDDGDGRIPMWEENLVFALQLQQKCEELYPGITRPLNFGDFVYNMDVNNGSLLIEVGTDANTAEEAVRTGEMLGNALAALLQKG